MNLRYLLLRAARHFMPPALARWLLRHRIIIRPGLETSDPAAAVERYLTAMEELGASFQQKRVLVLGYGGNFSVGCALLERGARHVVLCDPYAPPDDEKNRPLAARFPVFLTLSGEKVLPNPAYLTLVEADIRQAAAEGAIQPVEVVISSSVYEHLDDVAGITAALAQVSSPDGLGLHFVDLRDHYFRFSFEMLRYSERIWRGWLNPTSNLNRCRVWDYRQAFENCFERVEIKILARDDAVFMQARPRIRPEFLSGNQEEDAATIIRIAASHPKTTSTGE